MSTATSRKEHDTRHLQDADAMLSSGKEHLALSLLIKTEYSRVRTL